MDRFDAMQAYARVVETGSFTKAADTLQLSRATVTQLVQQLEARLRVRLLNRTTRKVNVTPEGQVYYERVLQLLTDLQDAETVVTQTSSQLRGRLRVDVPSPFASTILIPALPDFQARYPDIQLHLGVSDRMIDLIDENVDCVIRGGEIYNLSLIARPIADLQMGIYATPDYLAGTGMPEHPRDLDTPAHRVVGFMGSRARPVFPFDMQRDDEHYSVKSRYSVMVDEGHAYLAAGLASMGLIGIPRYMADAHVESGNLIRLFEDWQLTPMPLYLAYSPNRYVSARLRAFVDWVVELLTPHAPGSRV